MLDSSSNFCFKNFIFEIFLLLYYLTQEVLDNEHYDEKCDVFSYSIIAWEIFVRLEPYFHLKIKEEISSYKLMTGVVRGKHIKETF